MRGIRLYTTSGPNNPLNMEFREAGELIGNITPISISLAAIYMRMWIKMNCSIEQIMNEQKIVELYSIAAERYLEEFKKESKQ